MTKLNFEALSKMDIFDTGGSFIGRSEIQEDNNNSIQINTPIGKDGQKVLDVGQRVSAMYYTSVKVFKFETKVINRFVKKEHTKIFVLQKPEKYEIIQRRESVRVDCSIPLLYAVITETEKEDIISVDLPVEVVKGEFIDRLQKAMTFNISAGGFGIYTPGIALNRGDYILIIIKINGREEIAITRVVKEVKDSADFKLASRKSGLQLIYGGKGMEERLFQFMFQIMREQSFVKDKM